MHGGFATSLVSCQLVGWYVRQLSRHRSVYMLDCVQWLTSEIDAGSYIHQMHDL